MKDTRIKIHRLFKAAGIQPISLKDSIGEYCFEDDCDGDSCIGEDDDNDVMLMMIMMMIVVIIMVVILMMMVMMVMMMMMMMMMIITI